jgi:2-phosphosulfolactate phosphatase
LEIHKLSLDACHQATGVVVVIDVIRAFTTAAFAFAAGAQTITPVGTVEQALALRQHSPNAVLMGEVHGLPVEGFDYGNSPSALVGVDLTGRHIIQRTSAGTQGIVRSANAEILLAASLCCAGATARYVRTLAPRELTLVITGWDHGARGEDDAACADYLEALVRGERPDPAPFIQRVRQSSEGIVVASNTRPGSPPADLECCVDVDRFDFAMLVSRQNGQLVMKAHR